MTKRDKKKKKTAGDIAPKFMNKAQLAGHFGMSKRGIEEAILQTLAEGYHIGMMRPKSAKGLGHPRYNVADIERAWRYEHPLALAA